MHSVCMDHVRSGGQTRHTLASSDPISSHFPVLLSSFCNDQELIIHYSGRKGTRSVYHDQGVLVPANDGPTLHIMMRTATSAVKGKDTGDTSIARRSHLLPLTPMPSFPPSSDPRLQSQKMLQITRKDRRSMMK